MADPGAASQGLGALLGELAAFGLAIGFSPLHIGLLLLLLLGPRPLQRGSWFVAGWLITAALAVTLLLTVGHGLLLSMDKGSSHRTGLDLLAAGALLALGMKELLNKEDADSAPPGWTRKLDQFCAMPLPLLLAISAALEVARPDALFLFTKTAGSLLTAGLSTGTELGNRSVQPGKRHPAADTATYSRAGRPRPGADPSGAGQTVVVCQRRPACWSGERFPGGLSGLAGH
jgi:hypothetical protein